MAEARAISRSFQDPAARPAWYRYSLPIVATAVIVLIRLGLENILGSQARFILFVLLAALCAYLAGWKSGVLAIIRRVNRGVTHVLRSEHPDLLGQHASVLFSKEDREAGFPLKELETAARQGKASDERWLFREDGSKFWTSGYLIQLRDGHGNSS